MPFNESLQFCQNHGATLFSQKYGTEFLNTLATIFGYVSIYPRFWVTIEFFIFI